jgi:hypothetical protein
MEFVDGECLEEAWPSMSPDDKQSVAQDLRRIVNTMRQARPDRLGIDAFVIFDNLPTTLEGHLILKQSSIDVSF